MLRNPSSQVQVIDCSISPVITDNVEITSFRCCCINMKPVDVELTLFCRRCNVANLDIITTPFWHRDLVEMRCVGTHACSFSVSIKGNRFCDFLFASLDVEAL